MGWMIMLYKLKYGNYCLTLQTNIPYIVYIYYLFNAYICVMCMMCYCVYKPKRYVYLGNRSKLDTEELKNNFPMNLDNFNDFLNDTYAF